MFSIKTVTTRYSLLPETVGEHESPKAEISTEGPDTLLQSALEMCKWNDPDLHKEIEKFEKSCAASGVCMSQLLLREGDNVDLPLVTLMKTKNHRAIKILHRNLTNGWVVPGLIKRTDDSLMMRKDSSLSFWGYQIFGKGCTYVGDLPNGIRSGKGKIEYASDWYYEGDFLDNKRHGVGDERIGGLRPKQHFGIFVDNVYQGNPWAATPTPAPPRFRRLRDFFA